MRELLDSARGRLVKGLERHRRYRAARWQVLNVVAPLRAVEIETAGRCNRACSYCPVSMTPKRTGVMDDGLFKKIIADLVDMGFRGTLGFHFYNEPLLDKRLERLIAHARLRLPKVTMQVFSNGDALTVTRAETLFAAGLDGLRISLHDAEVGKQIEQVRRGLPQALADRITCVSYYDGDTLDNRGGLVDEPNTQIVDRSAGCGNPTVLTVSYTGAVALCCNDYFVENGFGDLNDMTVKELWARSEPLRRKIYLGEYDLPICRVCVGLEAPAKRTLPIVDQTATGPGQAAVGAVDEADGPAGEALSASPK